MSHVAICHCDQFRADLAREKENTLAVLRRAEAAEKTLTRVSWESAKAIEIYMTQGAAALERAEATDKVLAETKDQLEAESRLAEVWEDTCRLRQTQLDEALAALWADAERAMGVTAEEKVGGWSLVDMYDKRVQALRRVRDAAWRVVRRDMSVEEEDEAVGLLRAVLEAMVAK